MPTRRSSPHNPADREPSNVSYAQLERHRESLHQRLERVRPVAKASAAYRTARALLGRKYMQASLAARVAVLQAAEFIISLLEKTPPL
jgi:hypothetical protein